MKSEGSHKQAVGAGSKTTVLQSPMGLRSILSSLVAFFIVVSTVSLLFDRGGQEAQAQLAVEQHQHQEVQLKQKPASAAVGEQKSVVDQSSSLRSLQGQEAQVQWTSEILDVAKDGGVDGEEECFCGSLAKLASAAAAAAEASGSWVQDLSHDQQNVRLVGLLYQCAAEVSAGFFDRANLCLEHITQLVSLDALARKLLKLVPGLYPTLLSSANSADAHLVPVARRQMFDMLPFMKLAYLTMNHAILEAMEGEMFVHFVDFFGPAVKPVQWIALFHPFRCRQEGPPHLLIAVVHDSKEFLANMAVVLSKPPRRRRRST